MLVWETPPIIRLLSHERLKQSLPAELHRNYQMTRTIDKFGPKSDQFLKKNQTKIRPKCALDA